MVFCSRWEWGEVGVMNYLGVGQGGWLSLEVIAGSLREMKRVGVELGFLRGWCLVQCVTLKPAKPIS